MYPDMKRKYYLSGYRHHPRSPSYVQGWWAREGVSQSCELAPAVAIAVPVKAESIECRGVLLVLRGECWLSLFVLVDWLWLVAYEKDVMLGMCFEPILKSLRPVFGEDLQRRNPALDGVGTRIAEVVVAHTVSDIGPQLIETIDRHFTVFMGVFQTSIAR